jgi:toxin ParE1/3/4
MSGYVLSPAAIDDLFQIWRYIADDNEAAADSWIERLYDEFEALTSRPQMGHTRRDLTSNNVLFWPVARYLVIYRVQLSQVEIVAVTHGSRDIPMLLDSR